MYQLASASPTSRSCTVALPVLAGAAGETLFAEAQPVAHEGEFQIQTSGRWRIGRASLNVSSTAEAAARKLYDELFHAVGSLHLCRIWNYVPRINEMGRDGLENYRSFCRGRSLAFEATFGPGFKQCLPSASAVGTDDGKMTVAFAACADHPRHLENPAQVPAYNYPQVHGPRAPSFSRASVVPRGDGRVDVFISGTASIEGHVTVEPGDTLRQIPCTLRNLGVISRTCGIGDVLAAGTGAERHFKIYLRHREDLAPVQAALAGCLLQKDDYVSFLRADVCRADLNIEIEASIIGATVR